MTPDPAEAELEASLRSRLEADLGADRFESASADGAERDEATALDAIVAPTVVVSAAAPEEARLTRRGDRWEVAFRGRTSHVPDSRGVRYLSVLLARAQEEVGVLELVSVDAGEPVAADGDLGDVLDPAARAAFRERLVALRADRERAERRGDGAALELIDGEVAAIGAALGAATGLGGRARRAGGDAERARKAVTNRIRHAMGVFETADPDVGAHLRNSVRTGAFCVYRPERPLTWTIDG